MSGAGQDPAAAPGPSRRPAATGGPAPEPVETRRDRGLQPERTRLAWRRTTLSWAVVELLVVRQGLRSDGGVLRATVVGLAAFAFVAFLWLTQRRMLRLGAARPAGLSARAALSVVGCTMALAVFGAVLIF